MSIRDHERSARTDLRVWAALLMGILFAWAGSTVDPATNCGANGECAPWLVPIAKWVGMAAVLASVAHLWVDPRRGSRIDPHTGDLVWWQRRTALHGGDGGRIHPSRIGRIRIIERDDDPDEIHIYDLDGTRQWHFDAEVIPCPCDRWASAMIAAWPHIRLDVS